MLSTYCIAHAVAVSYSDMKSDRYYILNSFLLLVSRLMFPVLGFVAFRFGQLSSCVALIITAAAIFTYTYFELDNSVEMVRMFELVWISGETRGESNVTHTHMPDS